MLGVISFLFLFRFCRTPPPAVAHYFLPAEIRCHPLRAGISLPVGKTRLFCVEVEPAEMLAPKGQATTINLSLPPPRGASQWSSACPACPACPLFTGIRRRSTLARPSSAPTGARLQSLRRGWWRAARWL